MTRTKSQWTLGGIGLWLFAAILATFVVCTRTMPAEEPAAPSAEAEIEVEVVE
jgi:hypothetical protein